MMDAGEASPPVLMGVFSGELTCLVQAEAGNGWVFSVLTPPLPVRGKLAIPTGLLWR